MGNKLHYENYIGISHGLLGTLYFSILNQKKHDKNIKTKQQ